jgi:hypothetical protein
LVKSTLGPKGMDKILQSAYVLRKSQTAADNPYLQSEPAPHRKSW